jgi:4-amino-4-deoxy-L-arabinose transferase-like glycosyltransferase
MLANLSHAGFGSWIKARLSLRRLPLWWSHVIFAGTPAVSTPARLVRLWEALLVVGAATLFFIQLDSPLQEPEETLYAEVSRQMLSEDRWLIPVRHGQVFFDKPPLFYWLARGCFQTFGIHDWAVRLVPCAAAFLCVLVTYAWGKRTVGARAAFAGAVILCLSPRFAQMARMVTMNSLLTLWVVAALAAGHLALAGPRLQRRWWLLSAVACGLGFLTKGPVALVLVAGPLLLYQWLDRRGVRTGLRPWLGYVAVVGAVALPWFILLAARDPNFVYYFLWIHHVRRFVAPIDHPQPVWYYVPLLLLGMLPWSLLVPGLVKHVARPRTPDLPQRTGALGMFLLAALWALLFFSASGCKRPSYILPVMPPLALALGCYVDAACSLGRLRPRYGAAAALALFLVLHAAGQWLLPWYADKYSVRGQLAPQVAACSADVPVLCYPHIWDGVSFYLQRNDVRVFRAPQLADMVKALEQERKSLVVVKEDASLTSFLEALPPSLEFVLCRRQHPVAVGWVCRK